MKTPAYSAARLGIRISRRQHQVGNVAVIGNPINAYRVTPAFGQSRYQKRGLRLPQRADEVRAQVSEDGRAVYDSVKTPLAAHFRGRQGGLMGQFATANLRQRRV